LLEPPQEERSAAAHTASRIDFGVVKGGLTCR
jgi:hypothetical protein